MKLHRLNILKFTLLLAGLGVLAPAQAADKKPNILVIFGDDIGYWNVSAYNRGMMVIARRTLTASRRKARSSRTTINPCKSQTHVPTSMPVHPVSIRAVSQE